MVDTLSPSDRSIRMSRIKGKDTRPELVLRRILHALGMRYRGARSRHRGSSTTARSGMSMHGATCAMSSGASGRARCAQWCWATTSPARCRTPNWARYSILAMGFFPGKTCSGPNWCFRVNACARSARKPGMRSKRVGSTRLAARTSVSHMAMHRKDR